MPVSDFISNLFECEDFILEDYKNYNDECHISFSLKRRVHTCPNCHALTDKVHDYRPSVIKDLPIMSKRTLLHYRKRRYHCTSCGKHFYENFKILPKYCRITTRLAHYSIYLLGERQSVQSVSRLIGVSNSTIFRRMKDINFPKPKRLPEVVLIQQKPRGAMLGGFTVDVYTN